MSKPMSHVTPVTLSLLLVVASITAGGVAAQETNEEFVDEILSDGGDQSRLWGLGEGIGGIVRGNLARVLHQIGVFSGVKDSPAPSEEAAEVQQFFNERSGDFVAYANDRVNASDEWDTLAISYELDDEQVTHYVIANHSNDTYDNASIVNSTDRTVDDRCTLEGPAARNAKEELETGYQAFIESGDAPDPSYMGRLTGAYKPYVECSFFD